MERIAIVGGGLAGLCTATSLAERGFEPVVYEASDDLGAPTAGIWIPPNGMEVLDRLDVADRVRERGVPLEHTLIEDVTGATVFDIDLTEVKREYGHTIVSTHRDALRSALLDRIPDTAVETGRRCTGVEQDESAITMQFSDGTTESADVVVGGDGIESDLRADLFPDASLRESGQVCYVATTDVELPASMHRSDRAIWGSGKRFGFSPLGDGTSYWFAPITQSLDPVGDGDTVERLSECYAEFPAPVGDLIAGTDPERVSRVEMRDLPSMDAWSKGRTVLVGDAAHAMTPNLAQGGAQALEDGFALAKCLADHGSHRRAFSAFEDLRRPKAERMVEQSWQRGKVAQLENGVLRRIRNFALRNLPEFVNQKFEDDMYEMPF
jgi:2-polyprenyl-6-methoxyphenol hydroxylase-like FAD-dependent oxidoreductase